LREPQWPNNRRMTLLATTVDRDTAVLRSELLILIRA